MTRNIKRKILLFMAAMLLMQLTMIRVYANSGTQDSAAFRKFVEKIERAYSNARYLGFSLKYYYANADQPDLYLDSLTGKIQMNGSLSKLQINTTELLVTDKYAIQVNNEDRTIYLAPAKNTTDVNPVEMLDSVLAHIKSVTMAVQSGKGQQTLTLDLPPQQAYTRIVIQVDEKTGFLKKIVYHLNTSSLVDKDMINGPGNPSPYKSKGLMEIVFADYQQMKFGAEAFRPEDYVNRVAQGHFEPSDRYKDYHIFLSSSNL